MSSSTENLSILLISDGRPGHFNLAEGIVAAFERLRPVDVRRLEVRRPVWMPGRVLSTLVNRSMAPERILASVFGVDRLSVGKPDLVISAGGNTLAANIAAARMTGAANIFYGSLRRHRAEDFSLVMTSYAAQADVPNRLMTLKPSKLDPDALGLSRSDSHETPRTLGLIIGGDSGTVRYGQADWAKLLDFVQAQHAIGTRWIVANAPRTPEAFSNQLAMLSEVNDTPIADFIDVRTAGPGTLGVLLAASDAVVCTADSSTMLSETVWMRRPVVAICPELFSLPYNESIYRAWLAEMGWSRQMPIRSLTPNSLADALAEIVPLDVNPLDALATQLQERLPQLWS